jgi:putative flavoprotein involved in K+ transport
MDNVIIVGGGQAGLATSRELAKVGVEHVVLERGRIGNGRPDR